MLLVLTASAWHLCNRFILQNAGDRFDSRVEETRGAISARMIEYEQVLRGAVGLFQASSEVSRTEWKSYVENSKLQEFFPGIQGLGIAEFASPSEKDRLIERVRGEGFPEFDISPDGQRAKYSAIIFLEPFDWRNQRAFGYDMYSNPIRREAMDRAIETGEATVSGKVVLVQETDQDKQNGFLMYLPVYDTNAPLDATSERVTATRRMVYAVFRVNDLMHGILPSDVPGVDFEIYDDDEVHENKLLYDSNDQVHLTSSESPRFTQTRAITLQGRKWQIYFESQPEFVSFGESLLSPLVAIGGLLVDVLLFLMISSLGRQRQVAEGIAQDMTRTLVTTVDDLKRSNRELDDFAYIVSHDLRSPLRNIGNLAAWAVEDAGEEIPVASQHHLERLTSQAVQMNRLLDDLLEYSRVGRIEEKCSKVDCTELIRNIVEMLSKPADFQIVVPSDLPTFETVKIPLETCLRNLISNAINHHDRVDGKVWVSVSEKNEFFQFVVADDGPGIDERYQERIFKIFQTLQAKSDSSGSGVGLAIVKKAAESYGGSITLSSQLGEGTSMILDWPKSIKAPANDEGDSE